MKGRFIRSSRINGSIAAGEKAMCSRELLRLYKIKIPRGFVGAFFFFIALSVLFCCFNGVLNAEVFRFQYRKGEQYKIISEVDQYVYINHEFSHHAQIINKAAIEVIEVEESDDKGETGQQQHNRPGINLERSGILSANFSVYEKSESTDGIYEWDEQYSVRFSRDSTGHYTIDPEYYMPIVRDVPAFPLEDLSPGDTYILPAWEVHDLREGLQVDKPFSFPINVSYHYMGKDEKAGKELDKFHIIIDTLYIPPPLSQQEREKTLHYPVLISEHSDQYLWWDNQIGRPHSYEEAFITILETSSGNRLEFISQAKGHTIPSPKIDKDKVAREIKDELDKAGVEQTSVEADEEGIKITLEDIQFLPDSAILMPSEKEKLSIIGKALQKFPEREILISGHTALAGTEAGRQQLSEERALAVAQYLLGIGAVQEKQVIIRGLGAENPIADNATAEGMRRNRRVEIKLLEN